MVSLYPFSARVINSGFFLILTYDILMLDPLHFLIMNSNLESQEFFLLILDRHNVPKDTNLQEILKHNPADYCIILNARHKEIRSLCRHYWMSSSFIHTPRSCVVLSRKGNPPDIINPPASVNWYYIIDNSPGLFITIQGIRILLAYLSPYSIRDRLSLLHTLVDTQYIDNYIPDIHLLITYLDGKKKFHPKFENPNYNWRHIPTLDQKEIISSSFHFFRNQRNPHICKPEDIIPIFDGRKELSLAVGGITFIPIQEGWETDYLYTHQALDHFSYRRAKP